jgi:hypothetical protein
MSLGLLLLVLMLQVKIKASHRELEPYLHKIK